MKKTEYSTLEIANGLDIKKERLRVWIDEGFVFPSIQKGVGPGTKHIFSLKDVYAIQLFRQMLEDGFNRQTAASCVRELRKYQEENQKEVFYIFFRTTRTEGNKKLLVFHFIPRPLDEKDRQTIDLEFGMVSNYPIDLIDAGWGTIYLVNFKELMLSVDISLGVE